MKKMDLIIIAAVLAAALIIYGGIQLNEYRLGDVEKTLNVYVDGELVESLSLEDDSVHRYDAVGGYNVVTVENGEAYVSEANCPNQACVHDGHVGKVNETVVCLPHRFHIEISGQEEVEIDAISQ